MTVDTDVLSGGKGNKAERVDGFSKKGNRGTKWPYTIEQNVLDTLVYREIISQADVLAAIEDSKDGNSDLESVLLDRYGVPKEALGSALSEYYQCSYLPYDERTVIDADLLKTLNLDYLKKNLWLPIARRGSLIDVLTNDPHDLDKAWDVRRAFPGMTIRYAVGLRRDIEQFLLLAKGQGGSGSIGTILGELINDIHLETAIDSVSGGIDENDSAIVRLTNQVIAEADRLGASDIHIEPYADRKDMVVRLRIDGTCFIYMGIPAAYRRAVVSRIKIMANLDIAERRKPQDGKIRHRLAKDREVELRVATLPTSGQEEDVVLRLLTAKQPMPLDSLDFAPASLQAILAISEKPHGIILCVGPTGSGKTTTLHAILKHINTDERKIWTAEDPVEITQDGLRQLQVHSKIGLTFATAMRAFLRADPDVIMIGEMRDKETADIAIEASLTGHLVLSTLHTNSAVETVVRLLDLGCDPFNFADAMLGVLAQRLCKRICIRCKEAYHPSREEYDEIVQGYGAEDWPRLGIEYCADLILYRGQGCEACNRTGYKGRIPLHELLRGSDVMKRLIQSRARTADMLSLAMKDGMVTLVQDGIQKVLRGETTYLQVRAVAMK
ncbi:MAG: type II/IV secretion system protein [Nitrospira sp.]|nr:MAG: type II/IV secretion system protein [Nitrospira sp.]